MKRLASTATATILAASTALAQMGFYSFGIGPFNNATNSNYATTAGYYAGGGAKSDSRTTLFGSMAGLQSSYVQRSVGIGAGALYLASNCYDCVAIGDGAGAKWRNRSGWVQIGSAFAYTNGILNIADGLIWASKGAGTIEAGPLRLDGSSTQDHTLTGNLSVVAGAGEASLGNIHAEGEVGANLGNFSDVRTSYLTLQNDGSSYDLMELSAVGGRLCVKTNGVLMGYLTITPPAQGGQ